MSREVIIKVLDREEIDAHARKTFYIDDETHEAKVELLAPYQNMGELIRCKDCKHMIEHKGYGYLGESAYTCEGNMGGWIYPNSFCSNAKRKEE